MRLSKPFRARLLQTGQEPTNGSFGKVQRRKLIPGATWSGCAFATRGMLTHGRNSLHTLQSFASPSRPESDRGVRTQRSKILGPKSRTGNRLRLPVSGVRRFCRGSVRGALPTVRTARAVWSFDHRMHSRWSQSYLLSRKHASFILLCASNCNTLKYWWRRGRLREWRSPYCRTCCSRKTGLQ